MIIQRCTALVSSVVAAAVAVAFVIAAACGSETDAKPAVVIVPLAAGHDTIGLSVTPGVKPFTQLVLEFADGGKKTLTLNVRPQTGKRRLPLPSGAPKDAKPAYEQLQADDSLVDVSGMNLRLFARPNLFRYTDPQQDDLLKRWDSLPGASQTFMHYEFRSRPDRVEMWINGCYAGVFPTAGGLQQVRVTLPAGAAIRDQASFQRPALDDKYCALDISRIAKPGAMRESRVLWPAGADRGPAAPKTPHRVEGIPLIVADGPGNGDVGRCCIPNPLTWPWPL